jgi:hypothetical protein
MMGVEVGMTTANDIDRVLGLGDGAEYVDSDGVTWLRLDQPDGREWKCSPSPDDYDSGCSWWGAEDLELLRADLASEEARDGLPDEA